MSDFDPIEAAIVLEKSAARIEEFGWYQGDYWPDDAWRSDEDAIQVVEREGLPTCALGAMRVVIGDDNDHNPAALALGEFSGGDLVHRWNDADGQTAENVVATMRACAASLRDPA